MAGLTDILGGIVSRLLPQPSNTDGQKQDYLRLTRYRELYNVGLFAKSQPLADEGSYYVAMGTAGTGIATIAALTTLADTSPFVVVQNTDAAGGKRAYLDYLKLIVTAAGTAGTQLRFAAKVDKTRTAPTGSASPLNPGTPINVNMDDARASVCKVYAGALVSPAATSAVRGPLGHCLVRPVIPVVGDTYLINFGSIDSPIGALIPSGTAIADRVFGYPPVTIGPGEDAYLHIWLPSQSAASSYEVELGIIER